MRTRTVGVITLALGTVILVFALWLSRLLPIQFSGWWRGTVGLLGIFSIFAGIGMITDKADGKK
ncbi:MAG: hypothetical protein LUC89_04790 [Oscillospiraceae bacterium]|nr:hypothetical protein [Oscillospiraceae bacterium]